MRTLLLLATLLSLVVTQALAVTSITNTKHDLSTTSTATINTTNYDEICIFCHTPHKAIDQSNAPLWNRSGTDDITITDFYNSATLDVGVSTPDTVTAKIAASDATLCLSCHDGSSLTNALQNPSNLVAGAQPAGDANWAEITGDADIGTDLHDDHPIGMVYETVVTATTDEWHSAPPGIKFYDGGVMWCSICHDVHDNTNAPFLAVDNTGSGLCLTCHDK